MSEDELRKVCPAAFKTAPTNPNVSAKYSYASTMDVVRDMERLGWKPVAAKQARERKNSSGIRSFHMIAFENPNVAITKGGETEAMVRVILTNSHDGFNSFKFMCGLFRFVCSNGLVVSDMEFANISIRHINYDFNELKVVVGDMIERIPMVVAQMNAMTRVSLTDEQKVELARETYRIRKGVEDGERVEVDDETIRDILTPVRDEDKADDLWTIFNLCQEKMIRGGFKVVGKNGKTRKQRSITSIKKDIDFNAQLWQVASRFIPVSAAA
jgi:hypothetical protein